MSARSKIRAAFVAFAVAAVVGGAALIPAIAAPAKLGITKPPVSPVIFPQQSLPLRFSHQQHLKLGAECDDCHNAAESSSSLDSLIPTEEACAACHPIDRKQPEKSVPNGTPPARCDACHTGYDKKKGVARVKIPAPNIKFDHKKHIAKGVACQTCHGDFVAEKVDLATRQQLPKMTQCLACHNQKQRASSDCATCHLIAAGSRIQTEYSSGKLEPSGVLRGDAHDMMFRTSHRAVAKADATYCETCHKKNFCVNCHNGVTKPMDFHGNDYLTLHPIEARRDNPKCSSCHRVQTFCVGCHSRSGVSADGRASEFSGRASGTGARFHPEGWVRFGVGGPVTNVRGQSHHAYQAQRNIKQCASCHREEFCMGCHSRQLGSFNINPHPAGWAGSRRCEALRRRAGRMCLRCHIDAAELSCRR